MPVKKGFALIPIIVLVFAVLAGAGILGWKYLNQPKTTSSAPQTNSAVDSNNTEGNKDSGGFGGFFGNPNSGSCMGVKPPRQSADGAFTTAFTDPTLIDHITNGSGTGDSRFTYLWIKTGQTVPVVAPADGVLVYIAYKTRADLDPNLSAPDYDVAFLVDCKTLYRINHITNPVDLISSQWQGQAAEKLEVGKPIADSATKPKNNIAVKAGDSLGTTSGTPGAHNFDFGVFVDNSAVCPYDKFSDPIRSNFMTLFGNNKCDVSGNY